MSLNLNERLGFSLRLSLWYAGLFTLSAAVLFWAVYFLLQVSLDRKDREVIDARARQYATIFVAGGPVALRRTLESSREPQDRSMLVRVLNRAGATTFISVPKDWVEFDQSRIDVFGRQVGWLRIPRDAERDLVIGSTLLSDGSVLQVGRLSNTRTLVLQPFKRLFLAVVIPIALAGFAGGTFLAYRAMLPIRQIASTARSIIQTGRMEERVPVPAQEDEFRDLTILLNSLLEKNQNLIRAMRDSLDNVSHDLRTPLTRLRGTAELALTNHSQNMDQLREALADCVEESDRVLTILNTLLDVAEAETGVMRLRKVETDVADLVAETIELYEYVADEKKIVVRNEAASKKLQVDPARLRQAFANLLDNAIKYNAPGGEIIISSSESNDKFEIHFKDTGPGISPEEHSRIWERLYRGDKSRSERGLGLGLSFVKAIVEAHEGKVHLESDPGKGSKFTVQLPLS